MAHHEGKFGRKKEEAIAALLSQPTVEQAARAVNIGTRTLIRWLQVPEFKEAYLKARREAFGQATARLQQASGAAVALLSKETGERRRFESLWIRPIVNEERCQAEHG